MFKVYLNSTLQLGIRGVIVNSSIVDESNSRQNQTTYEIEGLIHSKCTPVN